MNILQITCFIQIHIYISGADPGFEVRGGTFKKIAPSGGSCENFWGISCEKNHDFMPKNHIFSNFRGGAHMMRPCI